MSIHLGEHVVCGEFKNTRPNQIVGKLLLRNDRHLSLSLTGNCRPDLAGRHIYFEAPGDRPTPTSELDPSLRHAQVGPSGVFTAAIDVPGADTSKEDWQSCLYLEWYATNGRVLVVIPGAEVEDYEHASRSEEARPASPPAVRDAGPRQRLDRDALESFGYFCGDLLWRLDAASPLDVPIVDDTTQHRYMDDMFHGSTPDVPIRSLFAPPLELLSPDDLDDAEVELAFKELLARLAKHGLAVDVCEHMSSRDAYRVVIERVLGEGTVYPHLLQAGMESHFSTFSYCRQCDEVFDDS